MFQLCSRGVESPGNVWSAARLQGKSEGPIDRSAQMYSSIRAKMLSRTKVSARCPEQRSESMFRDQIPSGYLYRITFGGVFSTNHQFGHNCDHDCLFGHPIFIGCEGAYSACRSGLR
jgi:hypothetical protein